VARYSGRPIPPNQPISGARIFQHESGIHVKALLKDRRTYEPFPPEDVGAPAAAFVLGKHSGTAALRHFLEREGIGLEERHAAALRQRLQREAAARGGAVSPAELLRWYRELVPSEEAP